MTFSFIRSSVIASILCAVLFVGCAHRQLLRDSGFDPVAWLAAQGEAAGNDPAALRRYAGELTASPRLLRVMFSAADPVTQALARQVAAGNLVRLMPPEQWQAAWLHALVAASPETLLPVERIRLARGLAEPPNLLRADEWGRWIRVYGEKADKALLRAWVGHWAEKEADSDFKDLLSQVFDKARPGKSPRASRILLPFSGKWADFGWRLGYDFLAGFLTGDSRQPLLFEDSTNRLATAGKLVDSRVALVGPFLRDSVETYEKWRPANVQQLVFSASLGRRPGRIEFALRPEVIAGNLFDYLYQMQVRNYSLVVPQSEYGDRFARAFVEHCRAVTDATLDGMIWYREDLKDITFQARMLYGTDRYPLAWLEREEMDPGKVDGIVQHDVAVVIGRPVALSRVVRELRFQGSTFQAFAGDFGFNNPQLAKQLDLDVPLLFVDHFSRGLTGPQAEYAAFVSQVGQSHSLNLADLMLYEAGQWAGQDYARSESSELAGGTLTRDEAGLRLANYPLMVSGGSIMAADPGLIRLGIERQKRRYQAFQELLKEKEAEKAEEAAGAKDGEPAK